MNRAQRRKQIKETFEFPARKISIPSKTLPPVPVQDAEPDFSGVPLATVCQSIWLLINELRNRGYPVYDFDHKGKSVQSIKIIRDKVYFLAAEEVNYGDGQTESDESGRKAH